MSFYTNRFLTLAIGLAATLAAGDTVAQDNGTYDLYIVEVATGTVTQLTSLPGVGEFNAAWSNSGKSIVHDVLDGFVTSLYVTTVATGASTPLAGGEGGNDAAWSPNGKLIAFDRADQSLYVVSSAGGTASLVRANAIDAAWSNNGKRLAFTDTNSGSIRTVALDGSGETTVAAIGQNPAWSRDGSKIAYTDGNNLWYVPVTVGGDATGPSVQLTSDGTSVFNQQPSWAADSETIVFHSNRGADPFAFDFDIWTVTTGGAIVRVTGLAGAGDYDPAFSRNGDFIAYSGHTVPAPSAGSGKTKAEDLSATFALDQNYPNPFGSSTTIRVAVTKAAHVKVVVYDVMGREVDRLVDAVVSEGSHDLVWTPAGLSPGVYFYKMDADGFTATRQLSLLK